MHKSIAKELFNIKLHLYERDAVQFLNLIEFSKDAEQTPQSILFQYSSVIADSISKNLRFIPFYRFIKRFKIKRITQAYVLRNLSRNEIIDIATEILELEGIIVKKDDVNLSPDNSDKKKV